jgi:uncharacterized protein Yka (UPF0111/DUF47 family)
MDTTVKDQMETFYKLGTDYMITSTESAIKTWRALADLQRNSINSVLDNMLAKMKEADSSKSMTAFSALPTMITEMMSTYVANSSKLGEELIKHQTELSKNVQESAAKLTATAKETQESSGEAAA